MFDPAKAAEENTRINNLLMKEPEYEQIRLIHKDIQDCSGAIKHSKEQIDRERGEIEACESLILGYKNDIKCLLEKLEANTGFTKAPGIAHLTTIPAKFEVKDPDAVPAEFVKTKMTSSVDKVKLNKAIATGQLDTNVNWLEKIESYKTIVLE